MQDNKEEAKAGFLDFIKLFLEFGEDMLDNGDWEDE